jgi:GntR family transcriptional regulator
MPTRLPQRTPPLEEQVFDILQERITSGDYPVATRLPSESELAEELNVSRTTIRTALSVLSSNGLLKRRHGVGTFVSPLSQISNSLVEIRNYEDLITGQGFKFSQRHLGAQVKTPLPPVSEALGLGQDERVLEIEKAFLADGELLIYNTVSIPEGVYQDTYSAQEVLQPGFTWAFFEFMQQCGHPVTDFYGVVKSEIARSIPTLVEALNIDPYVPILVIEEIGYDQHGKAAMFQIEHLVGDRMTFEVARKRKTGP